MIRTFIILSLMAFMFACSADDTDSPSDFGLNSLVRETISPTELNGKWILSASKNEEDVPATKVITCGQSNITISLSFLFDIASTNFSQGINEVESYSGRLYRLSKIPEGVAGICNIDSTKAFNLGKKDGFDYALQTVFNQGPTLFIDILDNAFYMDSVYRRINSFEVKYGNLIFNTPIDTSTNSPKFGLDPWAVFAEIQSQSLIFYGTENYFGESTELANSIWKSRILNLDSTYAIRDSFYLNGTETLTLIEGHHFETRERVAEFGNVNKLTYSLSEKTTKKDSVITTQVFRTLNDTTSTTNTEVSNEVVEDFTSPGTYEILSDSLLHLNYEHKGRLINFDYKYFIRDGNLLMYKFERFASQYNPLN